MSLPFFDQNQGARVESRARLEEERENHKAWKIERRLDLSALHEAMMVSYEEAIFLQEEILPRARDAYEATKAAHFQGASSLTAVLDSQRSLFVLQSSLIEAQRAYLIAQAQTERLVGHSIIHRSGGQK